MSLSRRLRNSTDAALSSSSPNSLATNNPPRQFVIILTNNQELLQRLASDYQNDDILRNSVTIGNDTATYNTDREQLLTALLQIELRDATRDYLSRTQRSYPIQYVFNMSDVDLSRHRI